MRSRLRRAATLAVLAAGALLAGCASSDPYSAPPAAPQRTMRSPVVAPSGYSSPWWWPMPNGWWPWQ